MQRRGRRHAGQTERCIEHRHHDDAAADAGGITEKDFELAKQADAMAAAAETPKAAAAPKKKSKPA